MYIHTILLFQVLSALTITFYYERINAAVAKCEASGRFHWQNALNLNSRLTTNRRNRNRKQRRATPETKLLIKFRHEDQIKKKSKSGRLKFDALSNSMAVFRASVWIIKKQSAPSQTDTVRARIYADSRQACYLHWRAYLPVLRFRLGPAAFIYYNTMRASGKVPPAADTRPEIPFTHQAKLSSFSLLSDTRDDFRACFELHKKNKSASAQFLPLLLYRSAHRSAYVFICTCIHTFRQCDPERERKRKNADRLMCKRLFYISHPRRGSTKCFINS